MRFERMGSIILSKILKNGQFFSSSPTSLSSKIVILETKSFCFSKILTADRLSVDRSPSLGFIILLFTDARCCIHIGIRVMIYKKVSPIE